MEPLGSTLALHIRKYLAALITPRCFLTNLTLSCVGVWRNDRVEIIPNDYDNRITASYVAFSGDERLIGDVAKNRISGNCLNTHVFPYPLYTRVLT
jgi:hypothetical protein